MTQEALETGIKLKARIYELKEEKSKMLSMIDAINSVSGGIVYMNHHYYRPNNRPNKPMDLDPRFNKNLIKFLAQAVEELNTDIDILETHIKNL
jgi:hypothetical protein